jgi:hypothetical protein
MKKMAMWLACAVATGLLVNSIVVGQDAGAIVAWGSNYYGQCNVPAPNSGFVAVAAGGNHSLGLKANGSGACCLSGGVCEVKTQADCTAAAGTYKGDGSPCDPNPCPQTPATGACCLSGGVCQAKTQADCTAAAGTYQGDGSPCDPNPCPQTPSTGACCLSGGVCEVKTQADCTAAGGTYKGDGSLCNPTLCLPFNDPNAIPPDTNQPETTASTCGAGFCGAGVVAAVPLTLLGLAGLKLRSRARLRR